jgi:hypothetical protein
LEMPTDPTSQFDPFKLKSPKSESRGPNLKSQISRPKI